MKVARIYLRVSTEEQDLSRQDAIVESTKAAGFYVAGIYREKASGARADRAELLRLIPSQVWREALADSFTVGFWRLTEPSADQLIADLLEKRSSGDAAHYTSCWIKQAMQAPLPRSMPALLPWADTIRASSTCTL